MIAGLKPYPAMTDSGTPWLGEVPNHWVVTRLKNVVRPIDVRSESGSETLLSLRRDHGVVRYDEHFTRPSQGASLIGFKLVRAGQFVVNRLQANNGLVFHSRLDGLVSPDYSVFEPMRLFEAAFVEAALRTPQCRAHFRRESTGLGTGSAGFLRLYDDRFLDTRVALAPPAEQAAIVRFIDLADRRIRRYIAAKLKLIALLEEQKRAIIHRAVTRGLDPNVRLGPSGVDWLGDVPEHWEIWQIGHFAQIGNGSTPSRGNMAYWTGGTYPWLNSGSVNAGTISASLQFVTDVALRECHLPRVPPGSVLVAITGQGKTRGTAAILRIEATVNQHIAFITPLKGQRTATSEYLHAFLVSAYSELRRLSDDSGSTKGALTCEGLRHFRVLVPPLGEQRRIVQWSRDAAADVEVALRVASREIELLREVRIRLVADVVTGKLDVREAAANLPTVAEGLDVLDEPATAHDEDSTDDDTADEMSAEEIEA